MQETLNTQNYSQDANYDHIYKIFGNDSYSTLYKVAS